MLAATGDTTASLEQHRLALAVMQALAATAPDDPANLRQLGVAHHKVGNVLGNPNYPNVGDSAGALAEMRAVDRRLRPGVGPLSRERDVPAQPRRRAQQRRRHPDGARTVVTRRWRRSDCALETYEAQVREDPDQRRRQERPGDRALQGRPRCSTREGRTRDALTSLENAAAIQDQLAAADPNSARGPCRDRHQRRLPRQAAGQARSAHAGAGQPGPRDRRQPERSAKAIPTTSSCASPSPWRSKPVLTARWCSRLGPHRSRPPIVPPRPVISPRRWRS